ncbi:MAG: hypothetical protein U0326_20330 [Polyangiales bacterium]
MDAAPSSSRPRAATRFDRHRLTRRPRRLANNGRVPWPVGYGDDATCNPTSAVFNGIADNVSGMPAAALRGGRHSDGASAGVNSLSLNLGLTMSGIDIGFRCVVGP